MLPKKILRRLLRDDLEEEVLGDLDEKFRESLRKKSPFRARMNYWYEAAHYVRPFALRKSRKRQINHTIMLQSYLKIGWRNLIKSKLFSTINISGMAISMACFLIIALFIHDEFSFDKNIVDADRKYRIYNDRYADGAFLRKEAMVQPMIAPTLAADYPEVESYVRFMNFNDPTLFRVGDKAFSEGKGGYADAAIFDMFNLTLIEGDPKTALTEPSGIAINRTLKEKYFGDKPAVGESIQLVGGPTKVVEIEMKPGTYEAVCTIPGHKEAGMTVMIEVGS